MSTPKNRTESPEKTAAPTDATGPRRRSRRRRSRRRTRRRPAPEPVAEASSAPETEAEAPAATDEVTVEAVRIEQDAREAHHEVEEQSRREAPPAAKPVELVGERLAGSDGIIVFRRPETSPCSRFRLKECFE